MLHSTWSSVTVHLDDDDDDDEQGPCGQERACDRDYDLSLTSSERDLETVKLACLSLVH